eukprot:INCI15272.1.p1 GENE.INCI15272.1~~INCI15272.1.p1  ORF type:complete len:112 (+),score=12.54 INCI15272.1:27-362(+)
MASYWPLLKSAEAGTMGSKYSAAPYDSLQQLILSENRHGFVRILMSNPFGASKRYGNSFANETSAVSDAANKIADVAPIHPGIRIFTRCFQQQKGTRRCEYKKKSHGRPKV